MGIVNYFINSPYAHPVIPFLIMLMRHKMSTFRCGQVLKYYLCSFRIDIIYKTLLGIMIGDVLERRTRKIVFFNSTKSAFNAVVIVLRSL